MNGNMVGRVFNNRYQITERIGIGGMAEVYRAQDRVLGRLVAVKIMLPQYAADPEFTHRFRQEAASAANLQSPYIVNVYDWGQDEGTYYIVMEYVRGSDLKTAIQQRGAINQRKVAEIGAQVCKALTVAHNQDIIHRDIKPQNIMVQPDGNVKVMDFGIARAKNSVKSQTSQVLGTAHYISPEQAQGKELTAASDIYSLGVVMYEAATGKLPFDGPDAVSVAMKQVQEQPVPPSQIKPDIDPGLEAIIMRAMEKDPHQRFATANDMKNALNDFLAGRPVNVNDDATHVMGGYMPPMAEGTSVMPPVAGDAAHTPQQHTAYRSSDTREPQKNRKPLYIALAVIAIAVIAILAFALGGNQAGTVPNVTGQTLEQAEATLEQAGYTVGTTTEVFDQNVPSGSVVSTDPAAGTPAAQGTTVNLTVSKGKDQVQVPDLSGMTADQAKAALQKVGLTAVQGDSKHSSSVAEGKVCDQDPASGTAVDANSTVTFYLSSGPESKSVPDVTGMSESEATSTLQSAGFTVSTSTQASDSVAKGNVISQSPKSGSKAQTGSKVTIVISSGSDSKSVPDLTGLSQSDAENQAESAGFNFSVTSTESSSTVAKGYVIRQSPSAGKSAKSGTTIGVVVSSGPDTSSSASSSSSSSKSTNSSSSSSSSSSKTNNDD